LSQKTLEKGSVWEKADTNGDGVVTDREMAIKERMVLLSNMGVLASFIGFNQLAKRADKGEVK
jgi:hypothetical protein